MVNITGGYIPKPANISAVVQQAAASAAPKGFFNMMVGGIHLWILAFCIVSMCMLVGVMIYLFREKLNEKFLKLTKPERVIKVVIHYPNGMYRNLWRVLPERKNLKIGKGLYNFDQDLMIRQVQDLLPDQEPPAWMMPPAPKPAEISKSRKIMIKADGFDYVYAQDLQLKSRWSKYPEIHYVSGSPNPIDWRRTHGDIALSAIDQADLQENDLFIKLLSHSITDMKINMLMIIMIVNVLISAYLALKISGVIK